MATQVNEHNANKVGLKAAFLAAVACYSVALIGSIYTMASLKPF